MEQSLALINSGAVNPNRITTHRAPKPFHPLHNHPHQTLGLLLNWDPCRTPHALKGAPALAPSPRGRGLG